MSSTMRLGALFVLANVACRGASAAPDDPAVRFEHDMTVRFHMHENYGLVQAIERLLIRNKLDDAKSFANAIALAPDEHGEQAFAVEAARVRAAAASLARSATVEEACRRTATLAGECAGCHVASGVMPEFASPPKLPPDGTSIDARMARHLWAGDRLWEGVIGGVDDSWRTGLDVLAATPLPATTLGTEREALARQLQRLAKRGHDVKATERPAAYGDILATCAACHAKRPGS